MPSGGIIGWSGTAHEGASALAKRWTVGDTDAAGDVRVVGQGVVVRCTIASGTPNALPAPSLVGSSEDGALNTWVSVGAPDKIALTNLDTVNVLFVDGFSDEDAGCRILPGRSETFAPSLGGADPSQLFVWTAGPAVAWSAATQAIATPVGPAGAAGPAGPAGPTGPAGPAGSSGIYVSWCDLAVASVSLGAVGNVPGSSSNACVWWTGANRTTTGGRAYRKWSGVGTDTVVYSLWAGPNTSPTLIDTATVSVTADGVQTFAWAGGTHALVPYLLYAITEYAGAAGYTKFSINSTNAAVMLSAFYTAIGSPNSSGRRLPAQTSTGGATAQLPRARASRT